jgi:hypothetical protein
MGKLATGGHEGIRLEHRQRYVLGRVRRPVELLGDLPRLLLEKLVPEEANLGELIRRTRSSPSEREISPERAAS